MKITATSIWVDKNLKILIPKSSLHGQKKHGWDRCFHGTIRRETDTNGHPVVYGKIKVLNGFICAMAKDQWELGEKLDEMVLIVLEMGLHSDKGNSIPNGNISLN